MTSAWRARTLRAVAVVLGVACLVSAPSAVADPKDRSATRLADSAMNHDFAAADFPAAQKKLERAIASCERGCSAKIVARLHRDLAVVLITGSNDVQAGEREFSQALAQDPALELDPAFATEEVKTVFEQAKAQQPKLPEGETKSAAAGVVHQPVTEQQVGIPVPIYAELSADLGRVKGRIHYRDEDSDRWLTARMHRVGKGYGAEVPCEAVQRPVVIEYYIDFKNEDGVNVASVASKDKPLRFEVTRDAVDNPPHFPHRRPPRRCSERPVAAVGCKNDSDCSAGICQSGRCVVPRGPSHVWVGLALAQDLAFVSGSDVCSMESQIDGGFSCFRSSGSQYHGTPLAGRGDNINGGFALATTRVLLASEFVLSDAISLGLRLGYTLRGGGPRPDGGKAYVPWLVEARSSYWFSGAFGSGLSPYLALSGGIAQIDVSKTVKVIEDRSRPPPPNQIDNPDSQALEAWKKMGLSFAALGAGVFLPVAERSGLTAEARLMVLWPNSGVALEAAAGYAFGL